MLHVLLQSKTLQILTGKIFADSTYIYIGDFGNNSGSRTDLKIYRLLISDYLTTPNDTVTADIINFSYLDQSDFNTSQFSTNFDAEAIISYNDSLIIFTKNWGNNWTSIYVLPTSPGTYQVEKTDSIDVQGLITGGIYDEIANTILLSGYTFSDPFIVEISGFTSNGFSNGTINRYLINPPSGSSLQIEGITTFEANQYYLTAEINAGGAPSLYRLNQSQCPNDVNNDGSTTVSDLLIVLSEFGCPSTCTADVNGDGSVTVADVLLVLSAFGSLC